jgi:hypothetical protein
MIVHCPHDALVSIKDLKPNPLNRNSHPRDQIERLAKILEYQGWRYPIKVSKRSGFITSGHGRLEAAKHLGWREVPVSFQDYESDEQEYADLQADNAIATWSVLDLSGINADLAHLGPDFDIDFLGIKDFEIEPADKEEEPESIYTTKIESPIYEPKGEKPAPRELYDRTKTDSLIEKIHAAELPHEIETFLEFAAQRHTVFSYEKIAEYYAHAPKEVQELMEDSALVIIDFKKAIEHGFVQLTKDLAEAYSDDEQ